MSSSSYQSGDENDSGETFGIFDTLHLPADVHGAEFCRACRKYRLDHETQHWAFCSAHGNRDYLARGSPSGIDGDELYISQTAEPQPLTIVSVHQQLCASHHPRNLYLLYATGTLSYQKKGEGDGSNSERHIKPAITTHCIVPELPSGRYIRVATEREGVRLRLLLLRLYGLHCEPTPAATVPTTGENNKRSRNE
jgi:hypothetical protein